MQVIGSLTCLMDRHHRATNQKRLTTLNADGSFFNASIWISNSDATCFDRPPVFAAKPCYPSLPNYIQFNLRENAGMLFGPAVTEVSQACLASTSCFRSSCPEVYFTHERGTNRAIKNSLKLYIPLEWREATTES